MRIASVITAFGLAATAFALPAAAQTSGWYIGYKAGQSKYNFDCIGTCKDTGAGFGLFAGVDVHPNVAVEFGYADMGKTTFGSSNLRATIWEVSGLGSWWFGPRQQFGVYGRFGFFNGDLRGTTPSTGGEVKHGSNRVTYGIGGQYNLSKQLGARLEWQRYGDMGGGGFNAKGDVDLIAIGLTYRF